MEDKIRKLEERRGTILEGGGPKRVAAQHEKGKMTARERIAALLDPGSFVELDAFVEHRCTELGMDEVKAPARASSSATGRSTAARSSSSPRTSPSSAAPSARPTRRRYARPWTWP